MSKSRRQFLSQAPISLWGAALAFSSHAQQTSEPPPGAPPAFGTAAPVGPEVTPSTFAEAEKLMQVQLTAAERSEAAGNWRSAIAPLYEHWATQSGNRAYARSLFALGPGSAG